MQDDPCGAARELGVVERAPFSNENIHLEGGCAMDHIDIVLLANGVADRVRIHIEFGRDRADERLDVL